MPDPRHALGQRAELAASAWLTSRGWTILARRWRCAAGELDLVGVDQDGTLVAIEVKLRRGARAGDALESVSPARMRRLRAALGEFRAGSSRRLAPGARIDAVAVRPAADGRWRMTHHRAVDAW